MSTSTKQAVTYLHSPCKCGRPIDCTGDEVNILGTLCCGHFDCEECSVAYYTENNPWNQSKERIRSNVHQGYRQELKIIRQEDEDAHDLGYYGAGFARPVEWTYPEDNSPEPRID